MPGSSYQRAGRRWAELRYRAANKNNNKNNFALIPRQLSILGRSSVHFFSENLSSTELIALKTGFAVKSSPIPSPLHPLSQVGQQPLRYKNIYLFILINFNNYLPVVYTFTAVH